MTESVLKTALITGASSGIGWATTRLLASRDWIVYALARREDRLENLKKEFPKNVIPIALDLRKDLSQLPVRVDFRSIGVLINNAGLARGTAKIGRAHV